MDINKAPVSDYFSFVPVHSHVRCSPDAVQRVKSNLLNVVN